MAPTSYGRNGGGYLDDPKTEPLRAWRDRLGLPMTLVHTSGHATIETLRDLATALNPKRIVPIHTEKPEEFFQHFDNIERHEDGEWWGVTSAPSTRNT